jgi:hypothetical protein
VLGGCVKPSTELKAASLKARSGMWRTATAVAQRRRSRSANGRASNGGGVTSWNPTADVVLLQPFEPPPPQSVAAASSPCPRRGTLGSSFATEPASPLGVTTRNFVLISTMVATVSCWPWAIGRLTHDRRRLRGDRGSDAGISRWDPLPRQLCRERTRAHAYSGEQ